MMNIMAVGAHAADMEFSAGAILIQEVARGNPVTMVHWTLGELGHPTLSHHEYALQKEAEASEAARLIGCRVISMREPDAALERRDDLAMRLAGVIQKHRPHIVITHWPQSFHQDHRHCAWLVDRAIFLASLPGEQQWGVRERYYTENWEDQEGYTVDFAVDVTNSYERWLAVCQSYKLFTEGGILGFNYAQYYSGLFQMRGALARTTWAVGLKHHQDQERLKCVQTLSNL